MPPPARFAIRADPKAKFGPAIQKCIDKVDLAKKGTGNAVADYEAIGCPGDAAPMTSGDQRFADLTAFQAASITAARTQIANLALGIDVIGCAPGFNHTDDEADLACVASDAAKLSAYGQGLFKCQDKCENDYKAPPSKGSGGSTDGPNCLDGNASADPVFQACADAALAKAQSKGPLSSGTATGVLPLIRNALNDANNDLYNEDNCSAP